MDLQFDDFEIKVHGKRGFTPQQADSGDVGFDLHAPEDIYLPYDCRRMVDTGVVVETPEPLFCLVVPRSSTGTSRAHGVRVANTVGVIDPSYRGQDDTIGVCLEREARKREYIGTFTPTEPHMPEYKVEEEARKALGIGEPPYDPYSCLGFVSHFGDDEVDVFGYPETTESKLVFEEGDRFVQMVFIPFSRPDLVASSLDQFSSDDRGGFGSTGK